MREMLIAVLSILVSVCASAQVRSAVHRADVITATVCEVANNPERYDGKIVRIPATFAIGFEITALRDSENRCADIWVSYSDSTDPSLKHLARYSTASLKNRKHPHDYAPPRYAINAIFIGRLQYTHDSGFVVDKAQRVKGIRGGFGHLAQYKTQIVLESVTDLHTRDLLGTVYKSSEYEPFQNE